MPFLNTIGLTVLLQDSVCNRLEASILKILPASPSQALETSSTGPVVAVCIDILSCN